MPRVKQFQTSARRRRLLLLTSVHYHIDKDIKDT
jgi:hypothetical protein